MFNKKGFTLIELVTVIAIAGVLASIAIPSYDNYIKKSRRQAAIATLLQFELLEERFYSTNNYYTDLSTININLISPALSDAYYNYSTSSVSPTTYTIQAVAITGSTQVNDKASGNVDCSTLTIDQLGNKGPAACWNL